MKRLIESVKNVVDRWLKELVETDISSHVVAFLNVKMLRRFLWPSVHSVLPVKSFCELQKRAVHSTGVTLIQNVIFPPGIVLPVNSVQNVEKWWWKNHPERKV